MLGRLRHVALTWRVETVARRDKKDSWKVRTADGGGALNLFASHSLDYLEWLFGPICRVAAHLDSDGAAAEARVDAWLDLVDGPPISMSIATDAFLGCGHRLEVYGEEGALVLENRGSDYANGFTVAVGSRATGELQQRDEVLSRAGDGRVEPVGRLFGHFLDALLEGGTVSPNLEDALRVQRLLDMMREASRLGTWQT
jgi:predicted dehydrogenase